MFRPTGIPLVLGFFVLGSLPIQAAGLSTGSRIRVSTNQGAFNLSVFPGKAGFDAFNESPVTSGVFGDGTVIDYRFFHSPSDAISSYADSGAGMIGGASSPAANIWDAGLRWAHLWSTNDPGVSYNTTPNVSTADITFARSANLTGSIDISGLDSGTIYIPHGTFINQWDLTLTMTGPGQPTLTTSDFQNSNGPSVNYAWITDFSFTDAALYDTVTYTYTNQDLDGSRARFMGVILDGIATANTPPEVANISASEIGASSATIGGEYLRSGGGSPIATLFWGISDGGTTAGNWDHSLIIDDRSDPFTFEINGLTPATTYYFRAYAENSEGGDWADSTASFVTSPPPNPPVVINQAATGATAISAILGGEVTDTGGEAPIITIYYGSIDGGTTLGVWENSLSLGEQDSDFSEAATGLSPLKTYYFRSFAKNSGGSTWAPQSASFLTNEMSELIINEFLANNDGSYSNYPNPNQVPGRLDDWIEILNTGTQTLSLANWYLTDDLSERDKWTFPPDTSLGAGEFLLVYASGDNEVDANGNPHTNFSLSTSGEFLALTRPDLSIASAFPTDGVSYPEQQSDISYGTHPTSAFSVYFSNPTPGVANDPGGMPRVKDTKFSVDRGIYNSPFTVALSTDTPAATIYYTTDGAAPIDAVGLPTASAKSYVVPIPTSETTILRAAATKDGYSPTDIDTQTYVFLSSVAAQPANPPGFPTNWVSTSADYQIDPDVTNATLPGYSLDDALLAIPSIAINTASGDLFGSSGIYSNSSKKGNAWQRQASLEFFDPNDSGEFQIDCGVAVHGASSRSHGFTKKHSLRLLFKKEFGESKLRFPLFENSPAEEFDLLILRACSTDSWPATEGGSNYGVQRWRSQDGSYQRDQWMRDTQIDLGHDSARGRYVHLHLNGLYWGMYNIVERPNDSFNAAHFGGDDEDWDVIHDRGELQAGDKNTWNAMFTLADAGLSSDADYMRILGNNPDGTRNPAYPIYLDLDHFIDYMLFHIYAGAEDWPCHNYWAARRREPDSEGFRFYVWDQEISNNSLIRERTWCDIHFELLESDVPFLSSRSDMRKSPAKLYYQLRQNELFRNKFADRVHELLFNDGLLSPTGSHVRWMRRANEIDQAIVGESARWGDSRLSVPHKRETCWIPNQEWLRDTYWPANHDLALQRFRNVDLYPTIEAPVIAIDGNLQQGGPVDIGASLTFPDLPGSPEIYFTTDGSDPRLPGATFFTGPVIINESLQIRARTFSDGEWSALNSALFTVGVPLRVTELMYNPAGDDITEFIELMNISDEAILIAGFRFDGSEEGIEFTFDSLEPLLGPRERIVVTRDRIAFSTAYNTSGIRLAIGDYSASGAKLSNDGEQITLRNQLGGLVQQFVYNDVSPWPEFADNDGPSLVLISPLEDPGPGNPSNWRPSSLPGGSPGNSNAIAFSGSNLIDHGLIEKPSVNINNDQLKVKFTQDLRADDVVVSLQVSSDLINWSEVSRKMNSTYLGNHGMQIMLEAPLSELPDSNTFFRVHLLLR